jgi:hypothetical protein
MAKLSFGGGAPGRIVPLLTAVETGNKLDGRPLKLTLITLDAQYEMLPFTLAPKTTPAFCVLEEYALHQRTNPDALLVLDAFCAT